MDMETDLWTDKRGQSLRAWWRGLGTAERWRVVWIEACAMAGMALVMASGAPGNLGALGAVIFSMVLLTIPLRALERARARAFALKARVDTLEALILRGGER